MQQCVIANFFPFTYDLIESKEETENKSKHFFYSDVTRKLSTLAHLCFITLNLFFFFFNTDSFLKNHEGVSHPSSLDCNSCLCAYT